MGLPTPMTGRGRASDTRAATGTLDRQASPTPRRAPSAESVVSDDEDDDGSSLFREMLALLESERVAINRSTKIQLRHILDMHTDVYEARMSRYEETLARMRKNRSA